MPFGEPRVFNSLCLGPRGRSPKPGNLRFEALIGLAADALGLRGERRLGGRARSGFFDDLPGLLDCRGAERFGLRARLRLCEIELRRKRLLGFAPHAADLRREVLLGLTSNSFEFRDQCLARRRFGGGSCFDNRGLALLRRLAFNAREIVRALTRGFGLDSRNLAGTMTGRLGFDAGELACLLPGGFGLEAFDLALQPE